MPGSLAGLPQGSKGSPRALREYPKASKGSPRALREPRKLQRERWEPCGNSRRPQKDRWEPCGNTRRPQKDGWEPCGNTRKLQKDGREPCGNSRKAPGNGHEKNPSSVFIVPNTAGVCTSRWKERGMREDKTRPPPLTSVPVRAVSAASPMRSAARLPRACLPSNQALGWLWSSRPKSFRCRPHDGDRISS
ncbi:hypothetical protein Prede_0682 [Prevotella dentalis DSM 3688]|uniref:Uncharacterized protein n=1 Tax=Prevotella dentalis (strain ATCC 49559 / DSM 3688 / JCM 13448 / NCTC 12043 / ES 2772) TaxID=908937 RepID=L0JBQ9_PREDD|nr:hypothetical protein Prede_0682 [Prevotella dentalis DSM 3688]